MLTVTVSNSSAVQTAELVFKENKMPQAYCFCDRSGTVRAGKRVKLLKKIKNFSIMEQLGCTKMKL